MTRIRHVSTVEPKYRYETAEIIEQADLRWFQNFPEEARQKAISIFENSNIDSRYAIAPIETIFSDLSFEEKNDYYIQATIDQGEAVLKKALDESGISPKEIDYIITTSCTGFMIPSVDAYLVNKLGLKSDIVRLPVTEMGCAGGTAGLIYSYNFLKANPNKKVALLCLESPTITFQKHDLEMQNIISSAIFADGASCVILDGEEKDGPIIVDTDMYHFREATHLMGYQLQNTGLKIILDKDVPQEIGQHFPHIFGSFLEKNRITPQQINNYMFHPGGRKIIEMVQNFLAPMGKDISDSLDVLRTRGNMSSATIIHILERFMNKTVPRDEYGYMLAFGPGFSAQSLMLQWR